MTTNLQLASLIARHVELESVTLASATVSSSLDPIAVPDKVELSNRHRARLEKREVADRTYLYVYADFSFSGQRVGDETGEPLATLDASFLLIYSLAQAVEYPESALEHFAQQNGVYNAWPYWRELIQTVVGRVGLTGIVLPVFRPRAVQVEESGASASTSTPRSEASIERKSVRTTATKKRVNKNAET